MEKLRPTYGLDAIQASIGSAESLAITRTALSDALSLGFNRRDIAEVIRSVQRRMFYKSMTVLHDHRLWQDVYHVPARGMVLYIKFQADVVTGFKLMSFKEK